MKFGEPIHVEFDIDLGELFASTVEVESGGWDEPPSESYTPPNPRAVLTERIAQLVKTELVDAEMRTEILAAVKAQVASVVEGKITEVLDKGLTVTDTWGANPKTTTLNQMLADEVTKQLTISPRAKQHGLGNNDVPLLQRVIGEGVERVLGAELSKTFETAKRAVIKSTQETAARVIAEKIAREG